MDWFVLGRVSRSGWTIRGSKLGRPKRFLNSTNHPDQLWGLPTFLFEWYWGISHGKGPGNDVDRSLLFSAEVKNEWSNTSTPPICLHGVARDNLAAFFTKWNMNLFSSRHGDHAIKFVLILLQKWTHLLNEWNIIMVLRHFGRPTLFDAFTCPISGKGRDDTISGCHSIIDDGCQKQTVIHWHSTEISPTRCNNCVFILRNGFTLHVSGDNLTHHQEYICCIWPQVSRLT